MLVASIAGVIGVAAVLAATGGKAQHVAMPLVHPLYNDYVLAAASTTPPTEAQCFTANSDSGGRRCFTPQSMRSAYNVGPLYHQGYDGTGMTIAIVDAYGSDTIAHDLHVFDSAFGVTPMCGEEAVTCAAGMPKFSVLSLQGSPATKQQGNGNSNGNGLENRFRLVG